MNIYDHLNKEFGEVAFAHGWDVRVPEGLIVPYFATEFNRCIEHKELNRLVAIPVDASSGWYQLGPACRTNDMRKVESGWHSTVFEVLTSVGSYPRSQSASALQRLVADSMDFLISHLKLDVDRLGFTYFAGGEVIPGQSADPAAGWKELWLKAGISENNLVPVRGPKNYVLFVGDEERCGPKCEVLYRIQAGGGERWLEIGTLIFDDSQIRRDHGSAWRVSASKSLVAGAAYGLERLAAACTGARDFSELPAWAGLIALIETRVRQPEESLKLLRGDVLVLADQMRACVFLLAAGAEPDGTQRGRNLAVMLRRIRRKLATLCVDNWPALVSELEAELLRIYGGRYSWLWGARGTAHRLLTDVVWPEGWNPESYGAGVTK